MMMMMMMRGDYLSDSKVWISRRWPPASLTAVSSKRRSSCDSYSRAFHGQVPYCGDVGFGHKALLLGTWECNISVWPFRRPQVLAASASAPVLRASKYESGLFAADDPTITISAPIILGTIDFISFRDARLNDDVLDPGTDVK